MDCLKVSEAKECREGSDVSVRGIIVQLQPITLFPHGNCLRKRREVTLSDEMATTITVILWDDFCENVITYALFPVIFADLGVISFNNCKMLESRNSTVIRAYPRQNCDWDPLVTYRQNLLNQHGNLMIKDQISNEIKTFADINIYNQPMDICFYTVKARVIGLGPPNGQPPSYIYDACPIDACRKRARPSELNTFTCTKCGFVCDSPVKRFKLKLHLNDGSDISHWVLCFLEVDFTPLGYLGNCDDVCAVESFFEVNREFIFRLQVKRYAEDGDQFNVTSFRIC